MNPTNSRNAGRKPIAKNWELMKTRPVRMTDAEWSKCKALGGAAFIRAKIKAAKVGPNVESKGPARSDSPA